MPIKLTLFTFILFENGLKFSFSYIIDAPSMIISFIYNNVPQKITMKLPLTINKFFEPTEMNGESFFARWKNLGGYVTYRNKYFTIVILIVISFNYYIKTY